MQKITHEMQFITSSLPEQRTHYELWSKYKSSEENLYLVDIPKEEFIYTPDSIIIDSIVGYLTSGIFYTGSQCLRNSGPLWQRDFETYLKFVWLTESYIDDKIKFPVGGHWNPRLEQNVFHPGAARNVILKLFHSDRIKTVYFNTGGIKFNWLNDQKPITMEELKKLYSCSILFVLTADHGTLIPHVHFDTEKIDTSIPEYHRRIRSLLTNGIYANYSFDNRFNKLSFRKNKDCPIRILFKSAPSLDDQIRALMLWPINKKRIDIGNIIIEKDI
jgi:hypothetical protein